MYVHRDHVIYTCPLFEPHDKLIIGDAKSESILEAIRRANKSSFLRTISEGGTQKLYDELILTKPELKRIKVSNRHEACEVLGKYW